MPFPKNTVPGGVPGGGRIDETIKPGIDGLDAAIEPFGMYSGMTKRLARSDGRFCPQYDSEAIRWEDKD